MLPPKMLENLWEEHFSSKNAMNNAERKVFQTVSSANTVDCCRLLAVGCVAAVSREKGAKNKASFRVKTFYRKTGRHVGATSSLGKRAREPCR